MRCVCVLVCSLIAQDTVGDLKKIIAAQIGVRPEKIKLQKWHTVYKGEFGEVGSHYAATQRVPVVRLLLIACTVSMVFVVYHTDHITLEDYEIHDGMGLELYYN